MPRSARPAATSLKVARSPSVSAHVGFASGLIARMFGIVRSLAPNFACADVIAENSAGRSRRINFARVPPATRSAKAHSVVYAGWEHGGRQQSPEVDAGRNS